MAKLPNASAVLARLAAYPSFRFFTAQTTASSSPQKDVKGSWSMPHDAATVGSFSAQCLLTALSIADQGQLLGDDASNEHSTGGAVIGLFQATAPGSLVADWVPAGKASKCFGQPSRLVGRTSSLGPSGKFYNGMVAPLAKLSIRAVLWAQGEADAVQSTLTTEGRYGCLLQQLITSWRNHMPIGDYGFNMVQLPNGHASSPGSRVRIRQGQASCTPRPGGPIDISSLAVTADLGPLGAWPGFFNASAHRLAVATVHATFGVQSDIGAQSFFSGPIVESVTRSGSTVVLEVRNGTGSGLHLVPTHGCNACCSTPPFSIVDATRRSTPTVSFGDHVITLSNASAGTVEYAQDDVVECVVANGQGLPMAQFSSNATLENEVPEHKHDIVAAPPRPVHASVSAQGMPLTPPRGFNSWNYYHCTRQAIARLSMPGRLLFVSLVSQLPASVWWIKAVLILGDCMPFPTLSCLSHSLLIFALPFSCTGNIDEVTVRAIADAFVENGMKDAGYEYINLDDCAQPRSPRCSRTCALLLSMLHVPGPLLLLHYSSLSHAPSMHSNPHV